MSKTIICHNYALWSLLPPQRSCVTIARLTCIVCHGYNTIKRHCLIWRQHWFAGGGRHLWHPTRSNDRWEQLQKTINFALINSQLIDSRIASLITALQLFFSERMGWKFSFVSTTHTC